MLRTLIEERFKVTLHRETRELPDLDLAFSPDQLPPLGPPGARPGPDETPIDPSLPSIFTAIQEQLGLKLESTKGPVQILVIDRAERPTVD